MDFVPSVTEDALSKARLVAESNQFAIYAMGEETYLLVQRHASMPWTGMAFSGDGLFRVSGLISEATRDLYRELATRLSPNNRPESEYEMRRSSSGIIQDSIDTIGFVRP